MRFLTPLFFFLLALSAHAQFQVSLKLPRTNFVALEPIAATVTITNRTGAEAVLGGPGRGSWLSFEMTDSSGRSLAPMDVDGTDLAQIPPGGTIQRRVMVTEAYAPGEIGNYGLIARVFHSQSGEYYASARSRFNITDIKPMWQQSFGVPPGYKRAGTSLRYAVMVFSDMEGSSLYFRLIEDKTEVRLQTYRLGPVSMAHDPQITLDKDNNLQLVFLAQPHIFSHCIIAPDGSLKKRSYYREEKGDRPRLTVDAAGEAFIYGGQLFDPSKPPPTPAGPAGGRNLSEKPPGFE